VDPIPSIFHGLFFFQSFFLRTRAGFDLVRGPFSGTSSPYFLCFLLLLRVFPFSTQFLFEGGFLRITLPSHLSFFPFPVFFFFDVQSPFFSPLWFPSRQDALRSVTAFRRISLFRSSFFSTSVLPLSSYSLSIGHPIQDFFRELAVRKHSFQPSPPYFSPHPRPRVPASPVFSFLRPIFFSFLFSRCFTAFFPLSGAKFFCTTRAHPVYISLDTNPPPPPDPGVHHLFSCRCFPGISPQ